jgi:phosphoenolpyruvate-protein kinase (PTS system EI component)
VLGTPSLRPGAVWIGDKLGVAIAIVAIARGAAALVAADAIAPAALAACKLARVPAVSDVDGLFGWMRPGDLVAVDGDSGEVLVHPAPTDIERLRAARD